MDKLCIICGKSITEDTNNIICDECDATRNELSNGRGDEIE